MTVPADGAARLIHFVDERIAQLNVSNEEQARRGGPAPGALAKIRGRRDQQTPMVGTLLRSDAALGWQPGSAAVAMLGGQPLSLTARSRTAQHRQRRVRRGRHTDDGGAVTGATIHGHGRVLSPGSLRGRASTTPGPVMS
jgi:hypothetical protein